MMTLSEHLVRPSESNMNDNFSPRSKSLPGTWYYSSNHILINDERVERKISPLTRRRDLDEKAREQAEMMANDQKLYYEDPNILTENLSPSHRWLGENVARGKSIRHVHAKLMESTADRANIIDNRFNFMGIGTARGKDGKLYICQLFLG
uniref:SCP domain-containing protein n=1 Tax=Ditylum brightwellii TaxID=49249 RepID=A0A7S4RMZ1_9STRA